MRISRLIASSVCAASLLGAAGCKKEITCNPGDVEWGLQLAIDVSKQLNLDEDGNSLPTLVRLYQVRGELALETVDFKAIWDSEEVGELGEGFLTVEEVTIYPGRPDLRTLPVEAEATHVMAAALFREPLGTTWYSTYELPRRHPEVVCSKAPETKEYPDPCFHVFLDRSQLAGGPTPPPGSQPDRSLRCAPLGVVPGPPPKERKKIKLKRRKPDKEDLEDPLKDKKPGTPSKPSVPDKPGAPKRPSLDR